MNTVVLLEALRQMLQLWDDNHEDEKCSCLGASDDCKHPPTCSQCIARAVIADAEERIES